MGSKLREINFLLSFELIDYPNENSFFKFMPCLKLQMLRNNVVFDKDVLLIVSSSLICGRHPCIYTNSLKKGNEKLNC